MNTITENERLETLNQERGQEPRVEIFCGGLSGAAFEKRFIAICTMAIKFIFSGSTSDIVGHMTGTPIPKKWCGIFYKNDYSEVALALEKIEKLSLSNNIAIQFKRDGDKFKFDNGSVLKFYKALEPDRYKSVELDFAGIMDYDSFDKHELDGILIRVRNAEHNRCMVVLSRNKPY